MYCSWELKKKKNYFIRYQWLKNIKMPLSLSLSHTPCSSTHVSAGLNVIDPSRSKPQDADLRLRPTPPSTSLLLIRPTPTLSSPSRKPPLPPISLFPLLWLSFFFFFFFLIFFNVFSYKFGGYGGCGDG